MNEPHTLAEHCYYFLANQPKNETLEKIMEMIPDEEQIRMMVLINNGCPVDTIIKSFWQYMGICENITPNDDE